MIDFYSCRLFIFHLSHNIMENCILSLFGRYNYSQHFDAQLYSVLNNFILRLPLFRESLSIVTHDSSRSERRKLIYFMTTSTDFELTIELYISSRFIRQLYNKIHCVVEGGITSRTDSSRFFYPAEY